MPDTTNDYKATGYGQNLQWLPPFQLIDNSGTVQFAVASDGTLTTGASLINTSSPYTFSSTLGVTGNFSVNTNKFTVTATSGNTVVAGTLAVTGAVTITAAKPIIGATASPTSSGAGTTGMLTWDSSYLYICTASNTWARVAVTGSY